MYIDDDERPTLLLAEGEASYVEFYYARVSRGETMAVWSEVEMGSFAMANGLVVENVVVLGLQGSAQGLAVEVDGEPLAADATNACFTRTNDEHENASPEKAEGDSERYGMKVEVGGLAVPLGKKFSITWKMGNKD